MHSREGKCVQATYHSNTSMHVLCAHFSIPFLQHYGKATKQMEREKHLGKQRYAKEKNIQNMPLPSCHTEQHFYHAYFSLNTSCNTIITLSYTWPFFKPGTSSPPPLSTSPQPSASQEPQASTLQVLHMSTPATAQPSVHVSLSSHKNHLPILHDTLPDKTRETLTFIK